MGFGGAQGSGSGGGSLGADISTVEIVDGAVTYAKIQDISATDKILGRSTAGAGDTEEIACTAAGRAILDDTNAAAQLTTLGAFPAAGGTISGDVTIADGVNVVLNSTTGTKIGTATTQKLGFFNKDPVVQGSLPGAVSLTGTYVADMAAIQDLLNGLRTMAIDLGISA